MAPGRAGLWALARFGLQLVGPGWQRDAVGWALGTGGLCLAAIEGSLREGREPLFLACPCVRSGCRYEGGYLITHDLGNSFIRMPMRFSWRQVSLGTCATGL